jgi:hypothetical protein
LTQTDPRASPCPPGSRASRTRNSRACALSRPTAERGKRPGCPLEVGGASLLPHAHQRPADSDRERRRPDNPWRGADWENGPGVAGVPDRPDEREGSEPPPRPQVAVLAWASPWARRLPRRARRRVRSSRRDADRRMPVRLRPTRKGRFRRLRGRSRGNVISGAERGGARRSGSDRGEPRCCLYLSWMPAGVAPTWRCATLVALRS